MREQDQRFERFIHLHKDIIKVLAIMLGTTYEDIVTCLNADITPEEIAYMLRDEGS